jgi:hypothetical protein
MPDSTRNADFQVVPLQVKQRIKAAARSIANSIPVGMPDSTLNADFPVVPLKVKQRIKAAARSIGAVSATAHQLPTEIHNDRQETVNNINQQIQHGQPSSTSAASDSGKLENYV